MREGEETRNGEGDRESGHQKKERRKEEESVNGKWRKMRG